MSETASRRAMADIDKVAQAIFAHRRHHEPVHGWDDLYDDEQASYRAMATAAIDALGLTEESRRLANGEGGMSTNYATGITTSHHVPCTEQTRLVTAWRTTEASKAARAAMSDVVERARYCREWGNFDDLHGELLAEVEKLRSELVFAREGVHVRPMTETESNLMTQVLELRRELAAVRNQRDVDT